MNKLRLKKGNAKLHNVLIFDLPAVKSCLNCDDCKDSCYALKAQKMYPNVRVWRDINFELAKNHLPELKQMLVEQLSKSKLTTIRVHSSGDFFSQDYINMWAEVVDLFPDKNFYAYTKVRHLLDFQTIEALQNFNLIDSLINGKLNYGKIDYINELKKTENVFICSATKEKGIKCNLHCNFCTTKKSKSVVFIQH